jgi:hypothetical protein
MPNYIYRKRKSKNRFGIGFGKETFQIHFLKRSLYLFVPFNGIDKIIDKTGDVAVY